MRRLGFEPRSSAWKAKILCGNNLTTELSAHSKIELIKI